MICGAGWLETSAASTTHVTSAVYHTVRTRRDATTDRLRHDTFAVLARTNSTALIITVALTKIATQTATQTPRLAALHTSMASCQLAQNHVSVNVNQVNVRPRATISYTPPDDSLSKPLRPSRR